MKSTFWLNQFPAIFLATFIFILSGIPGDKFPDFSISFLSFDKLVHTILYCALGYVTAHALYHQRLFPYLRVNWFLAGILLTTLFAISDETHQHFVPNRNPDIMDINADLIGIVLSHILFKLRPTPWFGVRSRAK